MFLTFNVGFEYTSEVYLFMDIKSSFLIFMNINKLNLYLNLNISESHWTQTVVKIGIVGSVFVFPVGIVILTYHMCCERPSKEKGMSLQCPHITTHFLST